MESKKGEDEEDLNKALGAMSLGGPPPREKIMFRIPIPKSMRTESASAARAARLDSAGVPRNADTTTTDEHRSGTASPVTPSPATPSANEEVTSEEVQTPPHLIIRDTATVAVSAPAQLESRPAEDELADFKRLFRQLSLEESAKRDKPVTVFLSPLGYSHVFSRPWATKRYLSSIVERPQRLMALCLGIGTALRVGHSDFEVAACSRRTRLTAPHVTRVHGPGWGERLYELCGSSAARLDSGDLEVPDDWHSGDIYLCQGTVDALEGNLATIEDAFDHACRRRSRAFVALRPPGHHSHPCVPSGFCLINNVHIGIQYAGEHLGITHAVIVDFDLHHGDGTQDILWELQFPKPPELEEENNKPKEKKAGGPKIGYFSLHDINSFPTELGYATADNVKNASICVMAHDMSVWNVHLEPYRTAEEFDGLYRTRYRELVRKAEHFLATQRRQALAQDRPFKAIVVVSAGFDASEYEDASMQRHDVNVPTRFYNMFTAECARIADSLCEGRLVSLLEGGYSDAALATGVFSHLTGLAEYPWDPQWASPDVAKEYERGCKVRYTHQNQHHHPEWLIDGIRLGRSLWPEDKRGKRTAAPPSTDQPPNSARVLRDRARIAKHS
ncbi:hypothetical protein TRVA0_001S02256 [Trichomonascus vanleenenianus]|uniref:histone deacetylase n=1 Tax=Trichomonascus vanleenenianus TaxID=2268995 RepID=UPI003ECA409F